MSARAIARRHPYLHLRVHREGHPRRADATLANRRLSSPTGERFRIQFDGEITRVDAGLWGKETGSGEIEVVLYRTVDASSESTRLAMVFRDYAAWFKSV